MIYFDFMQKLEQITKLKSIVENKQYQRKELEQMLTGLRISMDGLPHGNGSNDKIGQGVERLEEIDRDIKNSIDKYYNTLSEVNTVLEQLPTLEYKIIYTMYVKGLELNQTADEIGVSRSTVFNTRKMALDKLKLMLD